MESLGTKLRCVSCFFSLWCQDCFVISKSKYVMLRSPHWICVIMKETKHWVKLSYFWPTYLWVSVALLETAQQVSTKVDSEHYHPAIPLLLSCIAALLRVQPAAWSECVPPFGLQWNVACDLAMAPKKSDRMKVHEDGQYEESYFIVERTSVRLIFSWPQWTLL